MKVTSKNYDGKFYIKLGRKYIPLEQSVEFFENLEKENERLKQQIKKMENCANCDYWFDMDSTCELHKEIIPEFMIDCGCKDWKCAYKEVEE